MHQKYFQKRYTYLKYVLGYIKCAKILNQTSSYYIDTLNKQLKVDKTLKVLVNIVKIYTKIYRL